MLFRSFFNYQHNLNMIMFTCDSSTVLLCCFRVQTSVENMLIRVLQGIKCLTLRSSLVLTNFPQRSHCFRLILLRIRKKLRYDILLFKVIFITEIRRLHFKEVDSNGNSCRLFALLNISCILYIVTDNGGNVFQ